MTLDELKQTYSCELEEITPEVAQAYLNTSKGNRDFKATLTAITRDMANGKFQINGDTICFDTEGNLLDGHHRLTACVRSDTPFVTFVVRGVDKDAFVTKDTGTNRTLADTLKIEGCQYHQLAAMIMPAVLDSMATGSYSCECSRHAALRSGKSIYSTILWWRKVKDTVLDACALGSSYYTKSGKVFTARDLGIIALHLLLHGDMTAEKVERFFDKLIMGEGAYLKLRTLLIADKQNKIQHLPSFTQTQRMRYYSYLWNHYKNGEQVKTFRGLTDEYPITF